MSNKVRRIKLEAKKDKIQEILNKLIPETNDNIEIYIDLEETKSLYTELVKNENIINWEFLNENDDNSENCSKIEKNITTTFKDSKPKGKLNINISAESIYDKYKDSYFKDLNSFTSFICNIYSYMPISDEQSFSQLLLSEDFKKSFSNKSNESPIFNLIKMIIASFSKEKGLDQLDSVVIYILKNIINSINKSERFNNLSSFINNIIF